VSFSELKQQEAVAERLRRSLERERLAHAYLFAGPRDSGKEATARTLAKALNCLEKRHDCCPAGAQECDSCRRVDEGTHPDVYWVRPESKSRRIQVDQMREFMKAVNLRSSMGRVKVGILVDADCMSDEASNAFLKTLEEPPAQTVIILLCSEPQRLLPTIRSRCLKISFGPVDKQLQSPHRARLLPLLARPAVGRDQRIVASYQLLAGLTNLLQEIRRETRARIEAEADLERYEELEPGLRDRLQEQKEARIEGEYRAERERLLEELYSWFGDVLLAAEGVDESLLAYPDQAATTRRLAAGLTWPEACRNLDAIDRIRDSLSRGISETLALEVDLLKLAQ
jgi:DNA polymerase-3 subunit delta'